MINGFRKPVKKVGAFCWLSLAICIVELLICVKFGHGRFHTFFFPRIRSLSQSNASMVDNFLDDRGYNPHDFSTCLVLADSSIGDEKEGMITYQNLCYELVYFASVHTYASQL
ncbi:hypothetical protein BHM03_00003601 [Ensete ventricosum]|nr:hypothetical protein BHM03_00003601 [Ensete ventricosum]